MIFEPPLVLDSNAGNASKNYPIDLRIYASTSDQRELYRLRYRAFRRAGWIAEHPEGQFSDEYDSLSSTFAVGAFHKGSCVGSLRLAFGGEGLENAMPCEVQFAAAVLRNIGGRDRGGPGDVDGCKGTRSGLITRCIEGRAPTVAKSQPTLG
jgi:hypothetical protein